MPRLIVQLPLADGWGTAEEIAARDDLIEALRDGFRSHGFGRFVGVEDGVGKTNLIFAERACDLDLLPAEFLRSELRMRGLLDRAVIAYAVPFRAVDGCRQVWYEVVWPEGFVGPFDPG